MGRGPCDSTSSSSSDLSPTILTMYLSSFNPGIRSFDEVSRMSLTFGGAKKRPSVLMPGCESRSTVQFPFSLGIVKKSTSLSVVLRASGDAAIRFSLDTSKVSSMKDSIEVGRLTHIYTSRSSTITPLESDLAILARTFVSSRLASLVHAREGY